MIDRGQLELDQLTQRLVLSRDRPKRQWLIERIGHIWSPARPRHCSSVTRNGNYLVHANPNRESISAVESFMADPHVNVRIAVAFAIGQRTVDDDIALRNLMRMLDDPHPHVRCAAVYRLVSSPRPSLMKSSDVDRALTNTTWTVRWTIASALHDTSYADRGWETLSNCVPTTDFAFGEWLRYCLPYKRRIAAEPMLKSTVSNRIQEMSPDEPTFGCAKEIANRLLAAR
ncbi:MAG: HEAT repeat domain-containing protein [Planctomycetales bacterium]|nr:HEAT repeat domain-containing protein [Planctomycetales bacterium]